MNRKPKTINIRLPVCSLSIRSTEKDGRHIAIFHHGIIWGRVTKGRLLRLCGEKIVDFVATAPVFIPLITAAPVFIPLPIAKAILDYINDGIDIDNLIQIIKYYK